MPSNKKYQYELIQDGDSWSAKITRKVTSSKRLTTKEKLGFDSQSSAEQWARERLSELSTTQRASNTQQAQKRKDIEEMKRLRSARRAERTEQVKAAQSVEKIWEGSSREE